MRRRKRKRHTVVVSPLGTGDAASIQEAMDQLPLSGGTIFLREGTWSTDGNPVLGPKDWSPRTGRCSCRKHR